MASSSSPIRQSLKKIKQKYSSNESVGLEIIDYVDMSFKDQAEKLFPMSLLELWYSELKESTMDLKDDAYILIQQMMMVFLRRLMRLASTTCDYNQLKNPCIETILKHIGWPKPLFKEAISSMSKNQRNDQELIKQLTHYFKSHKWDDFTEGNSINNLLYWLFEYITVKSVKDASFGRRKTISDEMLLNHWEITPSVIINDIMI